MTDKTTLLEFPCEFTIKIFGLASDEFEINALSIIHKHIPALAENAISSRPSKDGKYVALNVTMHVESKALLDEIYSELNANTHIIMTL
jgi:putative lipoic acid-binding regulatory protein